MLPLPNLGVSVSTGSGAQVGFEICKSGPEQAMLRLVCVHTHPLPLTQLSKQQVSSRSNGRPVSAKKTLAQITFLHLLFDPRTPECNVEFVLGGHARVRKKTLAFVVAVLLALDQLCTLGGGGILPSCAVKIAAGAEAG